VASARAGGAVGPEDVVGAAEAVRTKGHGSSPRRCPTPAAADRGATAPAALRVFAMRAESTGTRTHQLALRPDQQAASHAGSASWQGQALARGRLVPQQGANAFLGAVYVAHAGRRVHRDAGSTATVPRLPYAGRTRGRHVAGTAAARARRTGRGDGISCAPFNPLKRLRKCKTRKSDN
jgi:hypothetical protein